ncbi:lipocalin-like domain-containing protein [Roseovarius salinarum]|uniref:lipocalin-like domain-containing protein n=1 Tax=Roseovarius salinarum TaxID=1981892 RepID=UPI000C32778A|nr:lipocalin-like domain-containing protein [Roseovarius salinarum]
MNAERWILRAVRRALTVCALVAGLAAGAAAQGFAGLGTEAEGFALPDPDRTLEFPRDHGAHPAFRIEWWYLTANLEGADGRQYGVQWTLFRSALAPGAKEGWTSPQVWIGHVGLTTPDAHFHGERMARGGIGQAGVALDPFRAWIDEWEMTAEGQGAPPEADALDRLRLSATTPRIGYDLTLRAEGPLVFHGRDGYSVKSEDGQASHYYSQPFYRAEGTLALPGGDVGVTGRAWLDREWSSQPLSESQSGWDWISLHLEDGAKLMAFRLRDRDGPPFLSGTWIAPDGTATPMHGPDIAMTPRGTARVAGRTVPVAWRVEAPARDLDVTLRARNPDAWMDLNFAYWEGPVAVSGTHTGAGYLEMTGY